MRQVSQQCAPAPGPAPATFVVTHVVDGDTVDLNSGARVRVIGIDAPEVGQCGYAEASARMAALVLDRAVSAPGGARDDVDRYGRILRYIDVNGVDADDTLIREALRSPATTAGMVTVRALVSRGTSPMTRRHRSGTPALRARPAPRSTPATPTARPSGTRSAGR